MDQQVHVLRHEDLCPKSEVMSRSCEIDGLGKTLAREIVGQELTSMIARKSQKVSVIGVVEVLRFHGSI